MDPLTWFSQILTSPHVREWLRQQLIHLKSYEARLGELKGVVEKLREEKDRVQNKVKEEEETRNWRGIAPKVEKWINDVNAIISEYEKFDEDRGPRALAVFDLFTSGYLPKPGIRGRLSREAYAIIRKVNGHLQTEKFDDYTVWLGLPSTASLFCNDFYEKFPSRDETTKNIKDALGNPSIRMIGLHGLKGVGKTTLVKEVAKEVLDANVFKVIMADVKGNPGIKQIQEQIADMLGIALGEGGDFARAALIKGQLMKQSTLVILDDLSTELDFKKLGIPSENDNNPGQHEGCKVLLISESKQLLLSYMEEDYTFSMKVLNKDEAERLFKKVAGLGDGNSEFHELAAQIANKCNRLPISIVKTARELKNLKEEKYLFIWKDTLQNPELQKSTGAPESSTKLSYGLLQEEEQKTFLLCARMGRDALIMDLVKYCIGMGFLKGINTVSDARRRVHNLVRKLKSVGLLSDSNSSDHFTMQDIVRNEALSIASEEKPVFTMTKGKVDEWPDKLERYAAISLHHCDIVGWFPARMNCQRLEVFHFNNKDPCLEIPKNLFEGMKELKVLILTGIHLSPSESSIASLEELRMLCLEQCMLDKELSIIGKLTELRILSLSGSDIEKLPVELDQLKKLRIFDISNCSKLREIPSNVISSLSSLEELYLRNTSIQWKEEGQTYPNETASLSELGRLRLTILDIQIPNVACLPRDLLFNEFSSYKIVVGDVNAYLEMDFKMPEQYEASKFLAIQLKSGSDIHSRKGIKMLFEGVENLLLGGLNGVQDIYTLNFNGFPSLKHLFVSNSEIRSLINPKGRQHLRNAFPKLESLYLHNLNNLEEICSCQLSAPSFAKLKVIKINLCGQLKNVFSISMVGLLKVLETIEVSDCNSLEKIVPVETQSNINDIGLLTFPELRSLTLRSLSEFIGFYSMSSTEGETRILFHEKVVLSKLERMELSSIKIDIIWRDKTSLSSYFTNLIHLDVNDCLNLTYLWTFSMAKRLVNLQSLFVSECAKMRYIFTQGQERHAIMEGIFPNLKNIKLSSMKSLSEIWNCEFPSGSFGKLDTLIIDECDKVVNVFPCFMKGIFQSLSNLRVTNCRSMKAIFDLDDKKLYTGGVTNLQDLHLEGLPKLKHVWKCNRDQKGFLELNKMQKIWIHDCHSLENIFPFSEVHYLNDLQYLVVWDCSKLREIVAKGEGANTNTSSPMVFKFPKLTTIKFSKLPKLESFYPGAYKLSCPTLSGLSVELCDKLEPFTKGAAYEQRKPVLFPEEVINKLKFMQIESWHAKSSSSYMGKRNYQGDKLEELHLCRLENTDIPYYFLYDNPNMESLSLIDCFFEEIVRPTELQNAGVVLKLKSLKLIDLPNLKKIGFEGDIQRIELLILKNCPSLVEIMRSSVSLTHLTYLEVVNCNGLKTLMPPSVAKNMDQLNTMKIIKCESLKEVVENEEEYADIVFRQLKVLELVSLKSLKSFCNSKRCVFVFPSLEKLVVSACPKMENFSENVNSTPLLQKTYVMHENEKRWCWKDNLNATLRYIFKEKKYFEGMDEINVFEYPELRETWFDKPFLQKNWFYSLKTLKLKDRNYVSCAIPSNILPCLKSLQELEVRDCLRIQVIFEINDTEIMGTASQLKKLTLEKLPKLMHVWEKSHQVSLTFQNLQQVIVHDCERLQTLFPAALAKNLMKLEKLQIESCHNLLEIVEDETVGEKVTKKFAFPCLTKLHLSNLPNLTYFYAGAFTLECPGLNTLSVFHCLELELFQSAHLEGESESEGSLFSDLKAISNLEVLSLDWNETLRLRFGQSTENLTSLNELGLNLYYCDENEKLRFPFEILEKAPNVKGLYIYYCNSPKILLTQNPKIGEDRMLGHLEILSLDYVTKLRSVVSEGSSCLNTICESLHQLIVSNCPDLTTIVHPTSAVSFFHLRELEITECHGLNYLFTSSAAKQLMHLEEIKVRDCETMKTIVETENTSGGVKFEWLDWIVMDSLPSLECFYSGNDTLQLPFLIQVGILKCPKMETFSQGSIEAESVRGIQVDHDMIFNDDLNMFVELKFRQPVQDQLVVGDSTLLQKIWLKSKPVPDNIFCNLKSMVVEGCEFMSNAILPSHLLPSLSNLEELQVRKCNSVNTIFDHTKMTNKGPASYPLSINLKKLILDQLPILKHVWNEDPEGSLSLPFLEEVLVDGCQSIESLFPASVKKDKLQTLCVENCDGLMEIVAKDAVAAKEANKELIIFPSLSSLRLWNLPNLRCIYPGMHMLKWPMLRELDVLHCQMLKFFAEGASISLAKVTPCLKELSLGKEEAMMIEQGKLHVDLYESYSLKLQCFSDELDVFAFVYGYKENLQSIESLEVVHSAFREIFASHVPREYGKISRFLSNLKGLKLQSLPQLESIGLEHSWMEYFVGNLETLFVSTCYCLTNLTPSIVIFSSLIELKVEDCHGLNYLFKSSTAKTLRVLKEMRVTNCGSLQNIVTEEDEDEDDITFGQLQFLTLGSLPKLESFYSGSSTLNFPSLKQVSFTDCHNIIAFCYGEVVTEELEVTIDGVRLEGDINNVFKQGGSLN